MNFYELLNKLSHFNFLERSKILENTKVIEILKQGLLKEIKLDSSYYQDILKILTPYEILSLYDPKELITTLDTFNLYTTDVFLEEIAKIDINTLINYLLKDEECFLKLIDNIDNTYYSKLNYNNFKELTFMFLKHNININNTFFSNIPLNYQELFIKELNDKDLLKVIPLLEKSVINNFFTNDKRSLYIYDKLDLNDLIKKEIKFSDDILKKKEFFLKIKSDSLITLRSTINTLEKVNNPTIIENHLKLYEEEIINLVDLKTNLFKDYEKFLDDPSFNNFSNLYFFDKEVLENINSLKKEELLIYLKEVTNQKLGEVIIDYLFEDNIYNVWINIKEMLRYHDSLSNIDKVIDNETIEFYKIILNFDNISLKEKIDIYNKLKNTNFSTKFYNDLRSIKDKAYLKINDKLLNPLKHEEYIDKECSKKSGVTVYDLKDKEYVMLVRTQEKFRDIDYYKRGCYSIISNLNNQVFDENNFITFLYGYNSFSNDKVLHMLESDSFSSYENENGSSLVNRIMSADELVNSYNGYSEIQIVNDKKEDMYYAKKPDYLVVFDYVIDKDIEESKRLNIPIVVIKHQVLDKEIGNYDIEPVKYIKDNYDEEEYKAIRR